MEAGARKSDRFVVTLAETMACESGWSRLETRNLPGWSVCCCLLFVGKTRRQLFSSLIAGCHQGERLERRRSRTLDQTAAF